MEPHLRPHYDIEGEIVPQLPPSPVLYASKSCAIRRPI